MTAQLGRVVFRRVRYQEFSCHTWSIVRAAASRFQEFCEKLFFAEKNIVTKNPEKPPLTIVDQASSGTYY